MNGPISFSMSHHFHRLLSLPAAAESSANQVCMQAMMLRETMSGIVLVA